MLRTCAGPCGRRCNLRSLIKTRPAVAADASRISALLCANTAERGGALLGDWSVGVVTARIKNGSFVIVANDGPRLAGVLFTEEKAHAVSPPVIAMLRAWAAGAPPMSTARSASISDRADGACWRRCTPPSWRRCQAEKPFCSFAEATHGHCAHMRGSAWPRWHGSHSAMRSFSFSMTVRRPRNSLEMARKCRTN
jgi:hypothetical protein